MKSVQHSERRRDRESGFTLIELLVACILLVIVLVVLFSVILDIFHSSDRDRQRVKAQRAVTYVSDRLLTDMETMRAPNRNPEDTGGIEMMREAFTLSDHYWEIHDIVLANSDRLIFYARIGNDKVAKLDQAASTSCVEWLAEPDQSLHRRVYPYSPGCQDAIAQKNAKTDEEIVPAPDAENATDKNFKDVFSYYVTQVPAGGKIGSCTESHISAPNNVKPLDPLPANVVAAKLQTGDASTAATDDPATQSMPEDPLPVVPAASGAPVVVPGLGSQQVDRIVAVQVDLRSLLSVKGAEGDAHFIDKLSIPARQQYEFRYAIGCAE